MKISKFAKPLILPFIMVAAVASAQENMPGKQTTPNQQTMPEKPTMPNDPTTPEKPMMSNESTTPGMQAPSASDPIATATPDPNAVPGPVATAQATYPLCSATIKDQCMQGAKRNMMRKKPRSR